VIAVSVALPGYTPAAVWHSDGR